MERNYKAMWTEWQTSYYISFQAYSVNLTRGDNGKFGFTHNNGRITKLTQGSSADRSEIEVGDQIFSVNDELITEKKSTKTVINETGSFITLHLYKKGKSFILDKILRF